MRHTGLTEAEVAAWRAKPLNLDPSVGNRIGPFIVAFNEGRSSYVRRISDIIEQLHPYSQKLMKDLRAVSMVTVPISLSGREGVLALMCRSENDELSHTWVDTILKVRPTFVAGYQSLVRASRLEAYGRIATRFIDDEGTRENLLDLARLGNLPPTVGKSTSAIILVVDVIGSSQIRGTSEQKANLYGKFYDRIDSAARMAINGQILKKTGDGAILSVRHCDGLSLSANSFSKFSKACREAAIDLGGTSARICVHFGEFFSGLIGTNSSGAIDVIGQSIDFVCKFEGTMKEWKAYGHNPELGFTHAAIDYLVESQIFEERPERISGVSEVFGAYYLYKDFGEFDESVQNSLIRSDRRVA
jgi:hypothetical protein